MNPRDYQIKAHASGIECVDRGQSGLMVLPTGTGKTITMAMLAQSIIARNGKVLVLAHRKELIDQAADKIGRYTGIVCEIEMGTQRAWERTLMRSPIVVASKDSLVGDRLAKFPRDAFDLILTDEAHHATAMSYRRIYDHFEGVPHIGVTATPDRADKESLGQLYGEVCFEYDLPSAIRDGWLVDIRQKFIECESLDFSKVRTTAGDFNSRDLDKVMQDERPLHEMVAPMCRYIGDRRTLVFCVTVAHAEKVAEICRRRGYGKVAEVVHGKMDKTDREQLFARFGRGEIQVLCNVGITTEGWDDPAQDARGVQVIAMMRPTKSRALYAQCVGRGTRPLPGVVDGVDAAEDRREAIRTSAKSHVTVLDFVGVAGTHKLVHACDILGGRVSERAVEIVADRAERNAMAMHGDEEFSVLDELDEAEREAEAEKEKSKRRLEVERNVDVVAYAEFREIDIDAFQSRGITIPEVRPWERMGRPATKAQVEKLKRYEIPGAERMSFKEASKWLDQVANLPTPKQQRLLQRHGLWNDGVDKDKANALVSGLFRKWKRA